MHHISMSGLGRAIRCAFWAHESTPIDPSSSEEASDGTADHALIERAETVGQRPDDPYWLVAAMGSLPPEAFERGHIEVAVSYDPIFGTGATLPKSSHRDYSACEPGSVPGTVDIAWLEVVDSAEPDGELRTLVVRDWKCGPMAEQTADLPENSAQLAGLALALLSDGGLYADEGINRVRLEIALSGPTRPEPTIWQHTTAPPWLADIWREQIAGALAAAERSDRDGPIPGAHCRYCPAKAACPEATSSLAAVEHVSSQDTESLLVAPVRSMEHAAMVRMRIKLAEDLLERVKASLKQFVVDNGPVPLGDNKVLRLSNRTKKTVAYTKLTPELMAAAEACGAVSVSMWDELREGNAEPRKRKPKTAA